MYAKTLNTFILRLKEYICLTQKRTRLIWKLGDGKWDETRRVVDIYLNSRANHMGMSLVRARKGANDLCLMKNYKY
jgi:hypothetical protein